MRTTVCLYPLVLLTFATSGHATYTELVGEDPFAYDESESNRTQAREEANAKTRSRQAFGSSGDIAISVERLAGYARSSYRIIQDGPDEKVKIDRIHGLMNVGGAPIGYSTPRIAFDFFVAKGFHLGFAVGYGQNSGGADMRVIGAYPRFGYAFMFGDVVGLWPRMGVTYQSVNSEPFDAWMLAATLELPVVLVAGPHAMFSLGPRVDWGFAGQADLENEKALIPLKSHEYGGSLGMTLFF